MNAPQPNFAARYFTARYAGQTVLAIGAHPDDLELAIGGTLARLVRSGARVVMAVVSVPGSYEVRRAEAERGAEILGCELRVLHDGGCARIDDMKHYQLVGMLDALVRELQPAAVLTHSSCEFHRDHLTVHNAVVSTQRLKAFDFFMYHPTMTRAVPVNFHPRAYVDISDTIDAKMQAIEAHASQFGKRGIDTGMFRELSHFQGRMAGVEYAEGVDVGRMLLG